MEESDLANILIQVASPGATDEEIDRDTRQLLTVLRTETDVHSAHLERGAALPPGAKGDPLTLGSIAVQVGPPLITAVIAIAQAWAARGAGRSIRVVIDGQVVEGPPEHVEKIVNMLIEKKRRKR